VSGCWNLRFTHHASRGLIQEMTVHDALVVGADLVGSGELVEARVGSARVDGVLSEWLGSDAIEGRGLVKSHEWIGVEPVAARGVPPIDDGNRRIRVREQLVGKRHPRGAGSYDQVVRFYLVFHARDSPPRAVGAPVGRVVERARRAAARHIYTAAHLPWVEAPAACLARAGSLVRADPLFARIATRLRPGKLRSCGPSF